MTTPVRKPVYDHVPEKVETYALRRFFTLDLVENLFFGVTTFLTFVFAFLMLRQGVTRFVSIAYLLVFWAVLAYLALPRLHRVLTSLYVPDYFIGRSRTSDGLLGDPVNLALRGSAEQIHEAMTRAGWVLADPVNMASSIRIVTASITRKSYPEAPVSPLMLFGSMQEFAYQQEVEGNPAQRHHVRFWRAPEGWLLPGGHHVDWLAAGTYDRSVGFSLFTLQVTHKIDRDIDIERDYIVDSIVYAVPEATVDVIEDFSTGYHCRNGGGDAVATDGDLPIVQLGELVVPSTDQNVDLNTEYGYTTAIPTKTTRAEVKQARQERLLNEVGRRPFSIVVAGVMTLLSLLGSVIAALRSIIDVDIISEGISPDDKALTQIILAVIVIVTYLIMGALAWSTFRGSKTARLFMLALLCFSLIGQLLQAFYGERPNWVTFSPMSLDLATIYALTSLSARQWTSKPGAARLSANPR
ncbi:LssY C-terminal domain-containing protein [Austwickia chelonae]|uniref:LssY C-terminal domain-containing protein n=1 Tax=Austwickia chelonae TaxID=100225 RepID=UPI000E2400B6|nr:LssY C-terminal domain-containing protein [Austwickia chelonae]